MTPTDSQNRLTYSREDLALKENLAATDASSVPVVDVHNPPFTTTQSIHAHSLIPGEVGVARPCFSLALRQTAPLVLVPYPIIPPAHCAHVFQEAYQPPVNTPEDFSKELPSHVVARARGLSCGINESQASIDVKMQRRSSLAAVRRSKHALLERLKSDLLYQDRIGGVSELLVALEELHTVTRRNFVDMSFGGGRHCTMPEGKKKELAGVVWRRPSQITHDGRGFIDDPTLRGSWTLFGKSGQPNPDDVKQGACGDCWFLSSLSVLAAYQDGRLVKALFPGDQHDGVKTGGAFVVRLCFGGAWRNIVLDDQFPSTGGSGRTASQFAFARAPGQALWVALVEKAFAKECGGYKAIESGQPQEALYCFTGWPCRVYHLDQVRERVKKNKVKKNRGGPSLSKTKNTEKSREGKRQPPGEGDEDDDADGDDAEEDLVNAEEQLSFDELWDKLLAAAHNEAIMTTSSVDKEGCSSVGLVANHAYAVTKVKNVHDPGNGVVHRLVQLRNPHGHKEWTGKWSDSSTAWTLKLRKALDVKVSDDGVFWMALSDLVKYFSKFTVCHVRDSFQSYCLSGTLSPALGDAIAGSNTPSMAPATVLHGSNKSRATSVGGGTVMDAFYVETTQTTDMVLCVAQRPARARLSKISDVAIAIIKLSDGLEAVDSRTRGQDVSHLLLGQHAPTTLVASTRSQISSEVGFECTLDGPGSYVVAVVGLNHLATSEFRQFVVTMHSSVPIEALWVSMSLEAARLAMVLYTTDVFEDEAKGELRSGCIRQTWEHVVITRRWDGCNIWVHYANQNALRPVSARRGERTCRWRNGVSCDGTSAAAVMVYCRCT